MQRALLQYFRPQNQRKCIEALIKAHRTDLIGNGKECLVKPDEQYTAYMSEKAAAGKSKGGKNNSRSNHQGHGNHPNQRNNPLGPKGRNDRWQKEKGRKGR